MNSSIPMLALPLAAAALSACSSQTETGRSPHGAAQTNASMPSAGDPDEQFLKAMIRQHRAAIGAARDELATGSDPVVRALARETIPKRQAEIRLIQGWLAERSAAAAMSQRYVEG